MANEKKNSEQAPKPVQETPPVWTKTASSGEKVKLSLEKDTPPPSSSGKTSDDKKR